MLEAIVIDQSGYKVEYVLVITQENGEYFSPDYAFKDGESFVLNDIRSAKEMTNPRWNSEAWEETATPEEIEAKQAEIIRMAPQTTMSV